MKNLVKKSLFIVALFTTYYYASAETMYVLSGKCNVPLQAGMNSAKYQLFTYDGTNSNVTTDISCNLTSNTAGLYYNSTSLSISDLKTTSNYGTSSSSNRTMQAFKLAGSNTLTITLGSKTMSKAIVIGRANSTDALTIDVFGQSKSTASKDLFVMEIEQSFSGSMTINNTTSKEFNFFIYLIEGQAVTPTINSVTVSPASVTLDPNGTQQLTATVDATPASADKSVTWSSSNPSAATVSESGLVTAVAQGTATITATSNLDDTKSGTCSVTVNAPAAPIPVTAIALNKSTTTIAIGDSETLTINYTPADANTGKAVNWTSSNTSVATVDNSGKVTGVAAGTATITATSTTDASITASCNVTVQAVAVTGVSINPTSANLQIGGSTDLTYTISPANATVKTVSWSSDNTNVATVDANGKVTAIAAGTATITVTTTDGGKTATCSVTVTAGPPVPHTDLTLHVPEIYEAKDIAGGYNTPLTVVAGREYEVYYTQRTGEGDYPTFSTTLANEGKSNGISGSTTKTKNVGRPGDTWFEGTITEHSECKNASSEDEFVFATKMIREHRLSSTNKYQFHIKGYDQFSFWGMDKKLDPKNGNQVFVVKIDGVVQTTAYSTDKYTIRRYDITTTEHLIEISTTEETGTNKCVMGGFSLRVAQEPRVKYLKGNDSTQSILQTAAIQPVIYTTKYNNISGAETVLEWIGAPATGITLTEKEGDLSDTLTLSGNANCATGEYNYAVVSRYNGVETNRVLGKFFVKTDIKSITSTNATVYQNEEMDQIEFKYYALSADSVILTWTGTKPAGIIGNGNNGTYLIGGTPTQTGEYTYSITVQGADTTITGKITVRELDYGTNPVLYLYKNENAYESDGVRNYLKDNGWNPIERKAKRDGLRPDDQYAVYKLVVISEDVDANNPEVQQIIKENGAKQPVLNLKGFTYAKGEGLLGWGDPSNGAIDSTKNSKEKGTKIKILHADHPIFKNISNAKEGGEISILSNYALQGIMPIAIDMQYLTDQTLCMGTAPIRKNTLNGYYEEGEWVAAIHEILPSARGGKKYICLPIARNVTLTTTGERLIEGIIDYLVSPTPTTITAPDLLITGFSVKDDKNNEYAATIDQAEHTITLKLTPEEYQALDSLKEAKPIITHPDYTSVDPASGEEVKLTYAYLRPQKYIITDFINKNVYDFILELYNPQQGIEEVYEAGQWVNIFDIYGRKVATTNEDIYTMELPHGMYIIVTESGETMKIMK